MMTSISKANLNDAFVIENYCNSLPEGQVVTAAELSNLFPMVDVAGCINLSIERKHIYRIKPGIYVGTLDSAFGRYAGSPLKIATSYSALKGDRVTETGATSANLLGLTTQVPVRSVFLTSGPSEELILGKRTITLTHAPAWVMALPDNREGDTIRAIAHCGTLHVTSLAAKAKAKSPTKTWQNILGMLDKCPGWLTKAILQAKVEEATYNDQV